MGTIERLEILREYFDKEAIDYESYYVEGKHKEEGENLFETKETVINDLLKRISNLEFEVERLNNIINEIEDNIVGKINVLYQVREQSNAIQELRILLRQLQELKGSDKE